MFRLYSKGCEYAIRALIDIGAHGAGTNVPVRELCRRAHLPEPSTRKMLQALALRGFLRSVPGPNGGYQLLKAPDQISILDVIRVIDGEAALSGCVLGLPACNDSVPCAMHSTWKNTRSVMLPALERLTLKDVTRNDQKWVKGFAPRRG